MSQLFIIAAGLYGALGVAFAAISAHAGAAATLGSASQMLLFHAPALLALGLYGRATGNLGLVLQAGGLAILLGVALFAGDLSMRHYRAHALFPMAAPSGGTLMMFGWALVVVAGVVLRRP